MNMMVGKNPRYDTTVEVPPWNLHDVVSTPTMASLLPVSGVSVTVNGDGGGGGHYTPREIGEALTALQRYLPSSNEFKPDSESFPPDAFSCDNFRMLEFKVRRCSRGRAHDWTDCPYTHPGEKARRRDPRKYNYSASACPDFRKGACKKGDSCEFAHGVFECWLHPARYRTQACRDGTQCRRRVCFFAHTPEQLRVPPPPPLQQKQKHSLGGSKHLEFNSESCPPRRHAFDSCLTKGAFISSPTSTLASPPITPPSESSPLSPNGYSLADLVSSMHHLQLQAGFASPWCSILRPGSYSLPGTPTSPGFSRPDAWDTAAFEENDPTMERVESGKALRANIYAKISRNLLDRSESHIEAATAQGPDVGWVSELVNTVG